MKKQQDGQYWAFDCMNALLDGRLFPLTAYTQEEAEQMAADYEAIAKIITIENGQFKCSKVIYNPFEEE